MSYHMDVLRVDLSIKKGDPKSVEQEIISSRNDYRLWLGWMVDKDCVEPDIACFDWSLSFIRDLLYLRDLGVRGYITMIGSEDELLKFEVSGDAVRQYETRNVFRKMPNRVYRKPSDIR